MEEKSEAGSGDRDIKKPVWKHRIWRTADIKEKGNLVIEKAYGITYALRQDIQDLGWGEIMRKFPSAKMLVFCGHPHRQEGATKIPRVSGHYSTVRHGELENFDLLDEEVEKVEGMVVLYNYYSQGDAAFPANHRVILLESEEAGRFYAEECQYYLPWGDEKTCEGCINGRTGKCVHPDALLFESEVSE